MDSMDFQLIKAVCTSSFHIYYEVTKPKVP